MIAHILINIVVNKFNLFKVIIQLKIFQGG